MASHGRHQAASGPSPLGRILKILYYIVFALALLIVIGYAAVRIIARDPTKDPHASYDPNVTIDIPPATEDPDASEAPSSVVLNRRQRVYTCLIAGSDNGNGCADTIMLGVFDTEGKTASLISIPRDTLVQVNGKNYKINATYGIGGVELLSQKVSEMLAVPIDYYILVDLKAFTEIVNEIGGVWFTVPVDMDYDDPAQDLHIHLKAGYQLLDGNQAMGVMRCRNCYPDADMGRVRTQRAFLTALMKQTISLSNVSKVTALANIVSTYVDSNMPTGTMVWFGEKALDLDLDTGLTSATLPGDWIYPVIELRDEEVLALVNSLGIYEQPLPLKALRIEHK